MAKRLHRAEIPVRNCAGFTMIEVLVALIVIGVGALAIGGFFPRATRDIGASERSTRAAEYLQEGMERLTALPYNDPQLAPVLTHQDPENPLPGGFVRTWMVSADSPLAGCKTLRVEINWEEGSKARSVEAATVIASVGR